MKWLRVDLVDCFLSQSKAKGNRREKIGGQGEGGLKVGKEENRQGIIEQEDE